MRRTGWLLLATALLSLSATAVGAEEDRGDEVRPETTIRRAEARIERDDLAGALEILDAGLDALPAEERAVSWEHDLDGLYVNAVLIGSRHVYVLAHVHRWSRHPFVTVAGGPRLEDWEMGYDFDGSATCLDAKSGRPLWHRRTTGQWEAELDPESDDLLFWRRDLVRLDADTGAETGRSRIGEDWQRLDGLLVGAHPLIPRMRTRLANGGAGPSARVFNLRAKQATEIDVRRYLRMSPDESRFAALDDGAAVVRDLDTEAVLWRHEHAGRSDHVPFWLDADLVWRGGTRDGPTEILRLDGASGQVRWQRALARGVWNDRHVRLMGNFQATREWDVVGPLGPHLYAIGGDGAIHVLEAATGRLLSIVQPVRQPLAPPRAVGSLLVVAGAQRVRAVPLTSALTGRTPGELAVRMARARLLLRMNRLEEALDESRRITDRAPRSVDAWQMYADVATKAGRADEAVAARCHSMALAGARTSEALRASHGLLARIPVGGDVIAPVVDVPGRLLVGTRAGRLLHVDPVSLAILRDEHVPHGLVHLRHRHAVSGGGYEGGEQTLWSDAERDPDPHRTPQSWFIGGGRNGRVVRVGSRWIRPLSGGGVRVLDDETVMTYPSLLPDAGIETWDVHLGPGPALGFGTGGVYTLDEHLRPASTLVRFERAAEGELTPRVMLLASDGETLGLLVQEGREARLEIRRLDGTLRAKAGLGYPGYIERAFGRLRPLGGGYLFAGDRLLWLDADAPTRSWRFDIGAPEGSAVPLTRFVHTAFFTPPVLREGRIYLGCRDGGLYVFDADAVVR